MKSRKVIVIALSLISCGAFAQNDLGNDNDNAGITRTADSFGMYDSDHDGTLSREEYDHAASTAGIYGKYDSDSDGRISSREYENNDFHTDMSEWDTNDDDYVDQDEFNEGSFFGFDDNEDGHWDGDEWDDAGDEGWFDI